MRHPIAILVLTSMAMTMLATAAAAPDYTAEATLRTQFQVEGDTPYPAPAPYLGTLHFSALASRFDSGHGHGYRNELKLAPALRRSVAHTREHFFARVTPTLPAGAKTIIAQYHGEGLDTLVKVYVQDTADAKGLDGKADNGVFDVLVRILGTDGKEVTTALGTIRSGDSFDLDIRFADGSAQVAATTPGQGRVATRRVAVRDTGRNIYLKFGDYLQALDPDTQEHTIVAAKWQAYYQQHHIDRTLLSFSDVRFERDVP
jgi:hypothetical protein